MSTQKKRPQVPAAKDVLSNRVRAFGGNYDEAMDRLDIHSEQYRQQIDELARILASISSEQMLVYEVPQRGTLIAIKDIEVDESVNFEEAVYQACPDTDPDAEIQTLGEYFSPKKRKTTQTVILVNFGKYVECTDGPWAWAAGMGLEKASPRAVLTLVEKHPKLNKEIADQNPELPVYPMNIVSLEEYYSKGKRWVTFAWVGSESRKFSRGWVGISGHDNYWNKNTWYAFVPSFQPKKVSSKHIKFLAGSMNI